MPLAQEDKIPLVGLFTGAQMMEPLKHEIINVRASYCDQTREQGDKLWDLNIRKLTVIDQDDPFGKVLLEVKGQTHSSAQGSDRPRTNASGATVFWPD